MNKMYYRVSVMLTINSQIILFQPCFVKTMTENYLYFLADFNILTYLWLNLLTRFKVGTYMCK